MCACKILSKFDPCFYENMHSKRQKSAADFQLEQTSRSKVLKPSWDIFVFE